MPRVKSSPVRRTRRKKVLKRAKGYFGSKSKLYRSANEQVMHSYMYAYIDRRLIKRNYRKLWIRRINAACRQLDISYSRFMNGLSLAKVDVNRKMLSELAIHDFDAFKQLVDVSKKALEKH
ncbi:MAG: 50S ribosomal protein L20 [Bacilli bacterium]|jgi:large subunit ribosomal protein L20|nr:50S ribosomal protein L20 [Bacilli bacterium]NLN80699.1 50S ribosomal protein L20 [Erysipelotrichia bacterium]